MAEKFNPYRAGQPLSGTGNPNTGVWQRTWEDGGPGRDSFGGPQTPGGVADWSGDPWKPEPPGVGKGLSQAISSPKNNALLYGAVYGVGKKGEEEPDGPGLPPPNTQKASKQAIAMGRGTPAIGRGTPESEDAKTPLALNPAPNTGSNGTSTLKKVGNAHENIIPQRRGKRTTTVTKAGANTPSSRNRGAIDANSTDVTTAPQGQLDGLQQRQILPGNVGEGLTGIQMAYQQTVNRGREQAQRYDQLPTNDVPSHESIQQGVKDYRGWHEEAAQGAKSTSSPQSGKRSRAGANIAAFYNLEQDRK